jgi:gas vesicle protein
MPAPSSGRGRGSFLAGLGIGIAVGAAVALLLAPQSGADTRRALKRRGRRVRSRASDAWEDLRLEFARAKRALRRKRREARGGAEPSVDEP